LGNFSQCSFVLEGLTRPFVFLFWWLVGGQYRKILSVFLKFHHIPLRMSRIAWNESTLLPIICVGLLLVTMAAIDA
jgi:hypothetical protein